MEGAADTLQKALRINLEPRFYGTVAEIGAGQEVARWFFRAGGAAGSIAKSMSAYDMAVSDAVYGKSERYVSLGRLQAMFEYELDLNVDRLGDTRGETTSFFAFADTVVARSFANLDNYRRDYLPILSRDVLRRIASGDEEWQAMVPDAVAEMIMRRSFFGHQKKVPI